MCIFKESLLSVRLRRIYGGRDPSSSVVFHVHTRSDYMPLYTSLHRGGMSFAGAGRMQVGGDEKNSFMSRGIITGVFFF